MIRKKLIVLSFLLLCVIIKAYSENPSLHLLNPYFLKPNSAYIGAEWENIGLRDGFLNLYQIFLDYGVNENVLVHVNFPYLTLAGADDGGCFGDVTGSVKLSLAESDTLTLRLVSEYYFRFPTGVIHEDSYRRVNGKVLTYYPYTTGSPLFSPSLTGSVILEQFGFHLSAIYLSENSPDENLFKFNLNSDRVDGQLAVDYFIKTEVWNVHFNIRPVIYLEYKYNLSKLPIIPNGFYMTIENHIKIENMWKIIARINVPAVVENPLNNYNLTLQIGRYF